MIRPTPHRYGFFAAVFGLVWASVSAAQGTQGGASSAGSGSGLEAGGLAPPGVGPTTGPTTYDPGAASTEQALKEADTKDSGRGLEFVWLNAEAGYQLIGLQTFSKKNLVDAGFSETHQQGFGFGAGAGVRLIFLTLGARFRMGVFDAWQLWTLNAEAGLHLPMGRVEPYFTLGGGYASVGQFDAASSTVDLKGADVHIRGWNARAGFGMDVYITNVVTIGGNITGDALFLKRPKTESPPQITGATAEQQANIDRVYRSDGTSIGAAMTATAVVGLHF